MNYFEQLEKTILYIETNLYQDLKVEEVADFVGYSYFHFHRIFEACLGETVGNYIRIRKLTQAAHDLIYTDKKIIDIAFSLHFESQAAFSRAFKKVYQSSPAMYRKNRLEVLMGNKKQLTISDLNHLYFNITLQPKFITISEIKIVGMREHICIQNFIIPQMWKKFQPRICEIQNKSNPPRNFTVCEGNVDLQINQFTEHTYSSEIVGVEVTSFENIPTGMVSKTISGGKYAVFTHKGNATDLRKTYQYIWGTWQPFSKSEIDLRDDFELYDERFFSPQNNSPEIDIYIPIK